MHHSFFKIGLINRKLLQSAKLREEDSQMNLRNETRRKEKQELGNSKLQVRTCSLLFCCYIYIGKKKISEKPHLHKKIPQYPKI